MKARALGRTGLQVSEIGFGAWGIGGSQWIGARDEESLRALHRAVDLGVNFVDTALAYGDGHSETLVGRLLRERSETVYVATKVPPNARRALRNRQARHREGKASMPSLRHVRRSRDPWATFVGHLNGSHDQGLETTALGPLWTGLVRLSVAVAPRSGCGHDM